MHGGGSQDGVARVADSHFHRLVRFVGDIVFYCYGYGETGLPRVEGDRSRDQGKVGPRTRGGSAGDGVIHRHRFARRGRELDRQVGQGGGLVSGGAALGKLDRGLGVIVLDGVGVVDGGPQDDVCRVAQGDPDGFVLLEGRIVLHSDGKTLGGVPGIEGQGARGQGIVDAAAGGGAAGDRVINRHGLARLLGKRHLHGYRCAVFAAA